MFEKIIGSWQKEADQNPWDGFLRTPSEAGSLESIGIGDRKHDLRYAIFRLLLSHIRMGLELVMLPYVDIKPSLLMLGSWCWNILHYFRFNVHAFVLPKHVSHVAPGQPHCCSCSWQGESDVLFLQHAGRAYRPWPCLGHGIRPTGHGDQHTLLKLTLCCLFLHEQCSPSSACANGLTRGTAALGGGELFL